MANAPGRSRTLTSAPLDPLGMDEETENERRARILTENDLHLLWQLRNIREHRGISQTELARKMGITQPSLAAFESQDNDPRLSTIRRYAYALDLLIDHSIEIDRGQDIDSSGWRNTRQIKFESPRRKAAVARGGWSEEDRVA